MNARGARRVDLLREVLDKEVLDADGESCGVVDDIEFAPTPDGPAVVALRFGPGAWGPRLPALLALLARVGFGRKVVRVEWSHVAEIAEVIRLDAPAAALGLGAIDRRLGRWLAQIPGS